VQAPAYSTIKVLLAAAFWRAVERGELSEAEPYAFQLAVSDNDATNVVASFVRFGRVNDLAADLRLCQTAIRRPMMDAEAVAAGRENYTRAATTRRRTATRTTAR